MNVEYLTRDQWGARTDLARLGTALVPMNVLEVHVHHTAAVDTFDPDEWTRNRWDRSEALRYMRRLQTARPDLGLDVPYCDVSFVLEDLSVLMCEGRSPWRRGAHTAGHNSHYGHSVAGNFDFADDAAAYAFLWALHWRVRSLRVRGFNRLGTRPGPTGWPAWGHRDTSPKSCPGNTLYPLLPLLDWEDPMLTPDQIKFYQDLHRFITSPGPTTGRPGNAESLLHILEVVRCAALEAAVPATDHRALGRALIAGP